MNTQERPTSPDLADVIQAWIERYLADVGTAFPGRVTAYDASTQKADVQPLVRDPIQQADGSFEYADLPVLPAVSVVFPRVAAWALTFPVAIGDTVLVVVQQTSPGAWESSDGTQPTYPGDLRRHHVSHAVALVGYYPVLKKLQHVAPAPGTWPAHDIYGRTPRPQPNELGGTPTPTPPGVVLGSQDDDGPRLALCQDPTTRQAYVAVTVNGAALLRIDPDGTVHVGEYPAADFLALASKVDAVFTSLRSIFTAWTPVPNDGGAALKTLLDAASPAGWHPASVAAARAKGT
jgi:hypothetical protein